MRGGNVIRNAHEKCKPQFKEKPCQRGDRKTTGETKQSSHLEAVTAGCSGNRNLAPPGKSALEESSRKKKKKL